MWRRSGVNPGVDVHALSGREADRGVLLVAITERRTRADIDRLAEVLAAAMANPGRAGESSQGETHAGGTPRQRGEATVGV
jgi:hypothetical protein